MHSMNTRLWLTSALAIPLLAGCGRTDDRATNDSAGGTVAMSDSVGMGAPGTAGANVPRATDASVASFVSTVSLVEVESGRLASTKARHEDVKDYAEDMVDEHQKVMDDFRDLGTRSGWSLPDVKTGMRTGTTGAVPGTGRDTSTVGTTGGTMGGVVDGGLETAMSALRQSHDSTMKKLRALTGAQFDRAYIESQIAGHQRALDVLRQHATTVQNTELRDKVTDMQKDVEEHLRKAQEIAAKLTGASGS